MVLISMMKNFLVTGGAGFIGSSLARRLVDVGHRVITIDNLSTGYVDNIPSGVQFIQGDCQDPDIISQLPELKYDAIFHIAGQSSGEISFDNPSYDLASNTDSTLRLLKFALSVDCKRFIYASTMSVYGIKPDEPVKEEADLIPHSFYGVGKIASEQYMRLFEEYGIHSTALRLFNVYGPGQNMENLRQGMVSIFMAQMLQNNHIHFKGSKDRYRDFVYIDDVIDTFLACLDRAESFGKQINIGSGKKTTVSELINIMKEIYGKPVSVEYKGETSGDVHGVYADISLAQKLLGYQPKISLAQGLKAMLDYPRNK